MFSQYPVRFYRRLLAPGHRLAANGEIRLERALDLPPREAKGILFHESFRHWDLWIRG